MSSDYQGMRWFKCDLHVHTPEDTKCWLDDNLRLGNPRRVKIPGEDKYDETGIQEKARVFLRRCHELELEVIAVTNHNFSAFRERRDLFLTHLIEQNRSVAEDAGRDPLWIFPGFEVDIGYHLLCLFPPTQRKSDILTSISSVLTKLGLPEEQRYAATGPAPLRRDGHLVSLKTVLNIVQGESGGIVIAAHAFGTDGICDDARDCEDYLHDGLLCVEVPGFPLSGRARDVLGATNGKWKREPRAPAAIMSSDAKSLRIGPDGTPGPNELGYRNTWIKMSRPSIEALRQAFLDPESRIRLPESPDDKSPAVDVQWARVTRLHVRGTRFLEDQTVVFSPNLNCVIGGRGTGKSSLIEYLRLCTHRETEPMNSAQEQVSRLRGTLDSDTVLEFGWVTQDGVPEEVRLAGPASRAEIVGREVAEPEAVFRSFDIQIFSQKQLSEITKLDENRQASFLLPVIDRLCGVDVPELERRAGDLAARAEDLFRARRLLENEEAALKVLEQEEAELERQWKARAALLTEAEQRRRAAAADAYRERVLSEAKETAEDWKKRALELAESHAPLGAGAAEWPEAEWFQTLDIAAGDAKVRLARLIGRAADAYLARIERLTVRNEGWEAVTEAIRRIEEAFDEACRAKGLKPEDLSRLQEIDQARKRKRAEVVQARNKAEALRSKAEGIGDVLAELGEVWRQQYRLRQSKMRDIAQTRRIPTVGTLGHPFVEVVVGFAADRSDFEAHWNDREIVPDRRSKLGRGWEGVGAQLFEVFLSRVKATSQTTDETVSTDGDEQDGGAVLSPWEVAEQWLADPAEAQARFGDLADAFHQHLREDKREAWERTRLVRVRDSVDLILYRKDGTQAGSLREGKLSDGQRNTAVLALLLAEGRGPVVIDQPEDELDSDFIYHELVPMLRGLKERRQLILATHNANLPVNGDAELVYALEAREGRGTVRAEGGLDRAEVSGAVLDIMEGSEVAFRRRKEKYNF